MRLMGIDFGVKRIGIALSDALGYSAHPLTIIHRKSLAEDIKAIKLIADENQVSKIVLGLPLNMDGSEGKSAEDARAFAEKLKAGLNLPVELFDERLSSLQTERILVEEADMSRDKRKGVRDKIAASLFLQAYLDSHPNG